MILIIDNDTVSTHAICEILNYAGIPSLVTHRYKPSSHADRYRAVLFTSPEDDFVCNEVKAQISDVPLFAFVPKASVSHYLSKRLYDGVMAIDGISSLIIRRITDHQREFMLPVSGEYRLAGIDASVEYKNECYYFDTRIRLTKTECVILRFIIASFPRAVGASEIALHVFKPDKMPDSSNVRTHICSLNKKFAAATGYRPIISAEAGYMANTPITSADASECKKTAELIEK